MEEYQGLGGLWQDGVFFSEDRPNMPLLSDKRIAVEISRQNANLRQVRERLASQVKALGGNALIGFEYGQQSHKVWQQLLTFKWDTESWHGSGFAVKV